MDGSVKEKSLRILENRRLKSNRELSIRKEHLYRKCPRLEEIDKELALTGVSVAKAVFSSSPDVEKMIAQLEQTNVILQEERRTLLENMGLRLSDMQPHYSCGICQDTGYIHGKTCDCLKALMRTLTYQQLCQTFPLESMTFSSFDPHRHSGKDEKQMESILSFCKAYADDFDPAYSPSVYMFGGTGLGKTHLSLAIVGEIIKRGYSAIYGSWQGFVSKLEEQKFTAGMSMESTSDALTSCDLLILDDLGSEFITSFDISCLYQVLNNRMNRGLPTVISANLSPDQLISTYNDRIASRIAGHFTTLFFSGQDMRVKR